MALTNSVTIYNNIVVPKGSVTQQNPVALDVSANTADAISLNIITTTGSLSAGKNPVFIFYYCFSPNMYTASQATVTLGFTAKLYRVRIPNVANGTYEFNSIFTVPMLGNYFYGWYATENIANPFNITVNLFPTNIINTFITKD